LAKPETREQYRQAQAAAARASHTADQLSAHPILAEKVPTRPSSHGASLLPFLGRWRPRALDAVSLGTHRRF